ncbi:MAG: ATP-binding protein [Deferribacteraceae bacterium]|jgi:anti-sigma regulatory factor (Ser/Thr protein kinase)|nr:ATP-binding protein [Deferribacteraceae bacterium]
MRRIAYWLSNKRYQDILVNFCNSEGMVPIDISKSADKTCSYVFFITDIEDEVHNSHTSDDTPKCLISDSQKYNHGYYLVNDDFGIYSLRVILDLIHHGSILLNSTGSLEFGSNIKECYVGNNIADVDRFVFFLTQEILFFSNFADTEKIRIGFSEMLTNGIEHGNLNITNKEKFEATEAGTYMQLLNDRQNDPRYRDRRVYIKVTSDMKRIEIMIRDEGDGFDISKLPSPKDADQLLKLHGRGILITKAYFDEVKYNSKGNEVILARNLNRFNF